MCDVLHGFRGESHDGHGQPRVLHIYGQLCFGLWDILHALLAVGCVCFGGWREVPGI